MSIARDEEEEEVKSFTSSKRNKSASKISKNKDKSFSIPEKIKVENNENLNLCKQSISNLNEALDKKKENGVCYKLDVSENSIDVIQDLSKITFLNNLIELRASKNMISQFIDTSLKLLVYLDLSDNCLTEIPCISEFTQLKMLNLKNNQIKQCTGKEFKENKLLECFDISSNRIDRVTEKHNVTIFCKHISKLEYLVKFYCTKNKIFEDPKSLKFMLETLKGIRINPPEKFDVIIRDEGRMKSGIHYSESLSEMCSLIEAVSSFPLKAQKYLQRIIEISNKIKESYGEIKEGEKGAGDKTGIENEDKNNDLIETFIQTCQLIGETETNCQENIVTILINLGHITTNDFGTKCFCALQDLMSSSK